MLENIFKKVSYSTGFMYAKAAKLKNIADSERWKKIFSETRDFFIETTQKAPELFENAKDGLVDISKSFKSGFASVKGDIGNEAGVEVEGGSKAAKPKPEVKKPTSLKKEKRLKPAPKKKDKPPEDSQRIKEAPRELLNAELEKEIEEIDKRVAEVK